MGEGWGEGEYSVISVTYIPLPLIPSHQGRGNPTFYELVNLVLFKSAPINAKPEWLDNLSSPSVNSYLINFIFTSLVHVFEVLCSTFNIYYQVVIAN